MKINRILLSLSFLCLSVVMLLTIVDYNCFDMSFYQKEYIQNDTCTATGLNEDDLLDTTNVLFDYLHDERDDLNLEHVINGNMREVFDTREKTHMIDVKNLYQNAMSVRNILLIASIVLLAVGLYLSKEHYIRFIYDGYKTGVSFLLLIIVCIAILAIIDFNAFWLQFHYLFFTNDLFLLDPNTEILINMVPEQFFTDLVFRIIAMFISSLSVFYLLLRYLYKKVN